MSTTTDTPAPPGHLSKDARKLFGSITDSYDFSPDETDALATLTLALEAWDHAAIGGVPKGDQSRRVRRASWSHSHLAPLGSVKQTVSPSARTGTSVWLTWSPASPSSLA